MNKLDAYKLAFEVMLYLSAALVFVYAVFKDKYWFKMPVEKNFLFQCALANDMVPVFKYKFHVINKYSRYPVNFFHHIVPA